MINNIIKLLQSYKPNADVFNQLDVLTSARRELDKLIIETTKKVK